MTDLNVRTFMLTLTYTLKLNKTFLIFIIYVELINLRLFVQSSIYIWDTFSFHCFFLYIIIFSVCESVIGLRVIINLSQERGKRFVKSIFLKVKVS